MIRVGDTFFLTVQDAPKKKGKKAKEPERLSAAARTLDMFAPRDMNAGFRLVPSPKESRK